MPNVTTASILIAVANSAALGAIADVLTIAVPFAMATIVLIHALWRARGTTLLAPLIWCALSWATLAIALVVTCQAPLSVHSICRDGPILLAAASTFCPIIALLGAKRPQDRAWQFIVTSFWLIAIWPVTQGALLYPDEPIQIPTFWRWLYGAILVVEVVNYLPTVFCAAVALAVCGQVLLLLAFWEGLQHPLSADDMLPAVFFAAAATVLTSLLWRWRDIRRTARNWTWDRLWLDFRDDFGLVWGMRLLERVNSLARTAGADVMLGWRGFYRPLAAVKPPQSPLCESTLDGELAKIEPGIRNLLRRFVSDAWIDQRLRAAARPHPKNCTVSSPASVP
jgi:hypothetical protein